MDSFLYADDQSFPSNGNTQGECVGGGTAKGLLLKGFQEGTMCRDVETGK